MEPKPAVPCWLNFDPYPSIPTAKRNTTAIASIANGHRTLSGFRLACAWAAVLVLVTGAAEMSASTAYGKFGTEAKLPTVVDLFYG